jgi:nitrate/nitrite transporter NarK
MPWLSASSSSIGPTGATLPAPPKLLTGVHDLTKADAGARAAGFDLLAVIGRPLGGWFSDRVGATLVSFIAVAVLALVQRWRQRHAASRSSRC